MFSKETSLKIARVTLFLLAIMDLFRGFMHTFNIWHASGNIAKMSQTADTLQLMNTFGITNFLTAFIFIIVVIKAKDIAPYILAAIPTAYIIGIISSNITGVQAMQTSAWRGKYMMFVYLGITILVSLNYFISTLRAKKKTV